MRAVLRVFTARGCRQSRVSDHPRVTGHGGAEHAPKWRGLAPPLQRALWLGPPPWATGRLEAGEFSYIL